MLAVVVGALLGCSAVLGYPMPGPMAMAGPDPYAQSPYSGPMPGPMPMAGPDPYAQPTFSGPMPDPFAYYGSQMGGPDPYAFGGYGGPDPFASPFASAGAMPFQRTGPQPSPYGPDPFAQPSYSYSF
uniref:Galectin n=1 Tax=Graphocephala atropunctata TaxID=36148 RepID=A0A1B6L739_9HEMI